MATPARYRHINLSPPKGAQEAAKSFLAAVERGEGGDGLEQGTLQTAHRVARGEAITWEKADKLIDYWVRNERFLDADKGTPAWTSALGWYGRAGFSWANKLRRQKEAADAAVKNNDASTVVSSTVSMSEPGEPWRLFKIGDRVIHKAHPDGGFDVDPELVSNLLDAFQKARAGGYAPPILAEHKRQGFAFGVIEKLERSDGYVVAVPHYAEGVEDEVRAGRRPYISPTLYFNYEDPHTGEVYPVYLAEVSFVAVPHLKNLDQRVGGHYAFAEHNPECNGGVAMSDAQSGAEAPVENEDKAEMSPEDIRATMKDMANRLADLEGKVASMMEKPVENEDHDEDVEMSEQVARLRRELDTERNMRKLDKRLPGADDTLVADLAVLMSEDAERAERFIALAEAGRSSSTSTVQAPIGRPGFAPEAAPSTSVSVDEAYAEAREAVGPDASRKEVVAKMRELHPNVTTSVSLA